MPQREELIAFQSPVIYSKPFESPYYILVEGKDDAVFLEQFIPFPQREHTQFIDLNGKDNLPKKISLLLEMMQTQQSRIRGIAFFLDADDHGMDSRLEAMIHPFFGSTGEANCTFHTIREAVTLTAPSSLGSWTLSPTGHTFGCYCLPNNQDDGEMEDLLLHAVTCDDRRRIVTEFIEQLKTELGIEKKLSKRMIHALLLTSPSKFAEELQFYDRSFWSFRRSAFKPLQTFLNDFYAH
jgi:5S rRNA maturation endonuclease (ribonuclease M5)